MKVPSSSGSESTRHTGFSRFWTSGGSVRQSMPANATTPPNTHRGATGHFNKRAQRTLVAVISLLQARG